MPDFYFCRARLAVFVDGCFWHSCPKCGHTPKTNQRYWIAKLTRNKRRDKHNRRILRSQGISVVSLWECDLRVKPKFCLRRLFSALCRCPEPTS
jgi:DNA mismatch endonuclease (patch repair protein)